MRKLQAVVGFCAVLVTAEVTAEASSAFSADDWMRMMVGEQMYETDDVEKGYDRVWGFFVRADLDGDGVSGSDRQLKIDQHHAKARERRMAKWFENDANGNENLERDELVAAIKEELEQTSTFERLVHLVNEFSILSVDERLAHYLNWDVDQDGELTSSEVLSMVKAQVEALYRGKYDFQYPRSLPVVLDINKDGKIDREEYASLLRLAIDWADTERDGRLSASERKAMLTEADVLRGKFHKWEIRCSDFCKNFL